MITRTIQKIVLTILITLPTLPFAGGFEGFHIDVGVGKKYNDTTNFSGGAAGVPDISGNNSFGQIKAGYGFDISSKINLNGNIFYDIGNSKDSIVSGSSYITTKYSKTFGFAFEPGFYINEDFLIYGKLGYVKSDFKGVNETFNISIPADIDGPLYGFGAKYIINKNVYLGADIAKYDYGSSSGIDSLNRSVGFNAKQESGLISIGYKF
jgi:hypothetical protein